MKKTPSLFKRKLFDELVPSSEWVPEGEGVATRKYNGSCCLIEGGELFARYNAKHGKTPPPDFRPAQPEPDPVTGHWPGWVPVQDGNPSLHRHLAAWALQRGTQGDGTYELIGPGVQGGAEADLHGGLHLLLRHGAHPLPDAPRDFAGLREYLRARPDWEGLVWHHPDGRRVKVTRKGFV